MVKSKISITFFFSLLIAEELSEAQRDLSQAHTRSAAEPGLQKDDSRPNTHSPLKHSAPSLENTDSPPEDVLPKPIQVNGWLLHYIPTQQFKQHLHLCIYSHCLWQETPSQLRSCGWAAVAASPESQETYKSHTKVTEIHHGQNTLNYDPTRQNKANQTIKQADSHVLYWPEPGKLLVHSHNTPSEHSSGEESKRERLSRVVVPLPTTVPGTLCCSHWSAPCQACWSSSSSSKSVPEMAQRQVKSERTRARSWSAL